MPVKKPILAIETSERNCSVCLYFDQDKFFEFSISLKNAHSEKIFELIDKVNLVSGNDIAETGCIAVSAGPGSFTGLRIGMAAAKGLAFGSSVPLVPVPTFEAMALQLLDILPESTQFVIANRVNAEEIYFAKFQNRSNNYIFVKDLRIIGYNEFNEEAGEDLCFGNAVIGNKNLMITAPSAKYIAKWCEKFGKDLLTFDYDFLEPNYLKDFIIKGMKK
jgi:tRNA threonylcarbamoyladenosine biosynthesis protein TsaB